MNTLTALFQHGFKTFKQKPCITYYQGHEKESQLSYEALDRDTNQMANLFLQSGIKKGDHVVFLMDKSLAFVVAHIAIQKIGAVTIPLNPGFTKSELDYLLNDAEPKLILANPHNGQTIAGIRPDMETLIIDPEVKYQELKFFRHCSENLDAFKIDPDDPSVIIYTSGTTGNPKGAILTHENMRHNCQLIIDAWEITESDVLCHSLPMFHTHGLCFALHTLLAAGGHILLLNKFSPAAVIDFLMQKEQGMACTIFMAVPAMYNKILASLGSQNTSFDHVRLWTCGSAPLLPKDFERIKTVMGKEPVEREGMTETGMNFSNPLHGKKKPGSIGIPFPDLEVRIVAPETLADVAPGEIGEFWLKSPSIFPRYWKKPKETSESFVNGWFKTGDLGRKDEDGYYFLTDRIKNIIISGGENISPNEIEKIINKVDTVVESSVVGIPDPDWGEKVVAFVVKKPRAGDIRGEIQQACKMDLHNWKCPKEIIFIDKLPKNTMGKILKDALKTHYNEMSTGPENHDA